MKRFLLLSTFAVILSGCAKINDDSAEKVVTARYDFEVSTTPSKAVITGRDPLRFEFEAGDRIAILVEVYDDAERFEYISEHLMLPEGVGESVFKYECDLVYDGLSWNLVKGGEKIPVIEVTAREGFVVDIIYNFYNKPEGDYENWFENIRRKMIPLSAGDHTIVLDFSDVGTVGDDWPHDR